MVGWFAAPAPAAPVPAAGDAGTTGLAMVPAQAPIVLHVRGVERVKERLSTFLKAAVPDFGPVAAAQIDNLLQSGFEGRKLAGLDRDGPVFLALLELPGGGGEPPVALIARVTGYAAFRDGLLTEDERKGIKKEGGYERADLNGHETYFIDRQDYAAVTTSKDAAELLAKKPAGLDGKLSGDLAKQLLENDLSLYVNLAAVNKEYGDQIKSFRQLMEGFLDQMPAAGGVDKSSVEFMKAFYGGAFQAVEDGRAFLAALDFRPEGMNLHLQFQVGADTKTDAKLKGQKPAVLDAVGTLPAGMTVYTASHATGDLLKALAPMLYGAVSGEGEARAKVAAAVKDLIAAGPAASASGANIPASGVQVQTFADPAKAVAAQLALFRAMGEAGSFQNAHIKGKPEITENAEEYKGFKFHAVHITWDLDKMTEAFPGGGEAMKAAMKKLMGTDLRMWIGTDGKRVVTVTAKNWDAAKARLDAFLGGAKSLAQDPAYRATRKQLPAETTLLMLADAGRFTFAMGDYMLGLFKAMQNQMPLPFNLPDEMKPVKTDVSYLGVAITLRPENAGLDLFVPVTGVQQMRKVLTPLFLGGQ
ncbi:MAG TPA: hypothetical protein VGF55_20475 [Gemmataceae bacterium]